MTKRNNSAISNLNPRSLNAGLMLVAALSCFLHGCAATSLADRAGNHADAPHSQFDDRFGALRWGQWVGEWPESEGKTHFVLDWCRAEYSDYDIMQSKGFFRSNVAIVARLYRQHRPLASLASNPFIVFSGVSEGQNIRLWQVPLPSAHEIGEADDEAVPLIAEHIKGINANLQQTAERWQTLRMDVNGSGQKVELNFLSMSGLPVPPTDPVVVRPTEQSALRPHAWIGSSYEQDDTSQYHSFNRLVLLTTSLDRPSHASAPRSPDSGSWLYFGFFTPSNRDRRLEGEVPAGSLWKSREQFVSFIQKTQERGVESLDDPLPQEVQTLLKRTLGQAISGEHLKKDAEAIFGSWEALDDAACAAAEVSHLPVFATRHGDRGLVVSVQWIHPMAEQSPRVHSFRMLAIPHMEESVSVVDIDFGRFQQPNGEMVLKHAPHFGSWFRLGQ